ncbi:acyl-CoA dehydrogenase [Seongchinamella sediminis]|uniref:Acyl-CoA dehydrogenase n=1 Tax=Seongchinamella sediminis TaxID=2283635 RepID=A0A3L7E1M1_9GAMM|nr:acyl-CoA dehydrogenase family protein [Seongchinamella sediminis]RLQ22042.1 acyl-CoA dehydrogenase [Seongchinamella sediminis]
MQNPFETEERRTFRETIRRYVETEIKPFIDDWDEAGDFPWRLHEELGDMGYFGFGVSEDHGGLGFDDAFMRFAAAEEMARAGGTGVWAGVGGRSISIGPIEHLASEEIRARCLQDIVLGRKGSCLAITEPSGGSDVANMQTTAVRDGDEWVINGSKTFITGGMKGDFFVVAARTGGEGLVGISLFFVDADTQGFSRSALERKMGWWASDQATLYFDNCRVPAANLMGEENHGFIAIMKNFNYERLSMIAGALGMMRTCLEESIAWAQERQTFGKPLIRHQAIRHKIAEMSARIDQIEAYGNMICWQVNKGNMPVAEICKGKFAATRALEYVASEAMQIFGGAAYLRGNPVERIYREVKVFAIGGGSEEIMRDLAVRQMGL